MRSDSRSRSILLWILPVSGLLHMLILLYWPWHASPPPRFVWDTQNPLRVRLRQLPAAPPATPSPAPASAPLPLAVAPASPAHTLPAAKPAATAKALPSARPAPPERAAASTLSADERKAETVEIISKLPAETSPASNELSVPPGNTGNDSNSPVVSKHLLDGGNDLQGLARQGMGKIDRELRQAAAPHTQAKLAALGKAGPTAFENAVAAAGVTRNNTVEEITAPNGQKMTKYTGPLGSYCMWVPKPTSASTKKPALQVTNCPG